MGHWRTALPLLLIGLAGGCQRPYVMTEVAYIENNRVDGERDPRHPGEPPALSMPPTVIDVAGRETWDLSLEEAIQLGLQNNRSLRVVSYEPGEVGTNIETQLSIFDAVVGFGGQWERQDRDTNTAGGTPTRFDLFGLSSGAYGVNATAGGASQVGFTGIAGADLFDIQKFNAAGGFTRFAFSTDYLKRSPDSSTVRFNPAWESSVTFQATQPLLQGAGVEFNRAPTLIARGNYEQAVERFDVQVRTLLRDVEQTYWLLYFRYADLYSRELGLRLALGLWQAEKNKKEAGAGTRPAVAQAREQYEVFRDSRLQALDAVLQTEAALKQVLGLRPDDPRRLILRDLPTRAEYEPDWALAVEQAMDLRPELRAQRLVVRNAELELFRQKNGLLPDLTVFGEYVVTGLDNQFDQSIDRLTDNKFSDWTAGVRYRRPIGERAANAAVQNARLALGRQRAGLRSLELDVLHGLYSAYRNLVTRSETLKVRASRRIAATEFLVSQVELFSQDKTTLITLLEAQTRYANAVRDEALAIAQYNQSLVDWEFAKGTILDNYNVALAETLRDAGPKTRVKPDPTRRGLPIPLPRGDWSRLTGAKSCLEPVRTVVLTSADLPSDGATDPGDPTVLPVEEAPELDLPAEPTGPIPPPVTHQAQLPPEFHLPPFEPAALIDR